MPPLFCYISSSRKTSQINFFKIQSIHTDNYFGKYRNGLVVKIISQKKFIQHNLDWK